MRAASPPTVDGSTWLKNVPMKLNCSAGPKASRLVPALAISRQRTAPRPICTSISAAAATSQAGLTFVSRAATEPRWTARSER